MSVSPTVTYKQVPPKRPGEADIINGTKENATSTVPPHMPAAEEYMQMARQIAAMARTARLLRLTVDYTAGVPYLVELVCMRDDLVLGDFTVTDNGVGDVSITWPVDKLPASSTRPLPGINQATPGMISAVAITNGVHVRTQSNLAVDADIPFTVEVG